MKAVMSMVAICLIFQTRALKKIDSFKNYAKCKKHKPGLAMPEKLQPMVTLTMREGNKVEC